MKNNKTPRMDFNSYFGYNKETNMSYENAKAFIMAMRNVYNNSNELSSLKNQYFILTNVSNGIETLSDGVIQLAKEILAPAAGKRDDVIRLNSARRALGIKLH